MPGGYRRFVVCCALAVVCAGASPIPSLGGNGPAAVGEARTLAGRILQRESDALLFDEKRLGTLVRELDRVLARVRERDPALATIRAQRRRSPGTLLLGVEADLFDAIRRLPVEGGITGNRPFDALNAKLGIRKKSVFPLLRMVALKTGERVNVGAAAKAYRAIDGVVFAEADTRLGDSSDIEAARSAGLWHIVFRGAWGDCPSGCTNAELFFFTVDGADVSPVESRRARGMAAFSALLARRGWK